MRRHTLALALILLTAPPAAAEMWIVTGQSNASVMTTFTPAPGVSVKYVDPYTHAETPWSPLGGDYPALAGHLGLELASIQAAPEIIAAARGGTQIACWVSGTCFSDMVWKFLYQHWPVHGVVWWQGESDALTYDPAMIAAYEGSLRDMIALWRQVFGSEGLLFVIVELQTYNPCLPQVCSEPAEWTAIRRAQRRVASDTPGVYSVPVADLSDGDVHPPLAAHAVLARRIRRVIEGLR